MMNMTVYKREMKVGMKMMILFCAVITMYVSIIIRMYDPEITETLESFIHVMPELMASVGMKGNTTTLLGFMVSYLYGFILPVLPMVFCILRGNALIAKYIDRGSMVSLVAAPVKRRAIAFTQMSVLVSNIVILVCYITVVELICIANGFWGELDIAKLILINIGLLCLHLFIGSICFLFSCVCSEVKYSIAFGAGIPALMYVLQMLSNVGGKAEKVKYFTFFTLFNPENLLAGEGHAILGVGILFVSAVLLYTLGIVIFDRKDLYI